MSKKRFNIDGLISGFHVGERIVDYKFLEEQIKKYRSPENFIIEITDDGHSLTYKECCNLLNNYAQSNESLQKRYKKQEHLINDLKDEMKCQRKNVEKIFKEYELLQEECLNVVNIIEDARREIFEGQLYAGYDMLENAIDKLQKIAYKEVY